jgi:hypothetical protein
MLRLGMVSSLAGACDAAYGGNSRVADGLAPTGPMPTLRERMTAFQSRGKCNLELIEENKIPDLSSIVRCGNNFVTELSMIWSPRQSRR